MHIFPFNVNVENFDLIKALLKYPTIISVYLLFDVYISIETTLILTFIYTFWTHAETP